MSMGGAHFRAGGNGSKLSIAKTVRGELIMETAPMASRPEKVVLVAGGTGGLGRAVSLAFLHEFATVIVTYRQQQELSALKAAAGEHSRAVHGYLTDVTDPNSVHGLVEHIVS